MSVFAALALAFAQQPGPIVSTEWLASQPQGARVHILQVESRADRFAEGHIPGARYLPYGAIVVPGEREVGAELPTADSLARVFRAVGVKEGDHVVVASTSLLGAARVWMTLDYLGWGDRASLLDGGVSRWRDEGRELATGAEMATDTGTFRARPRGDMVVSADWIHTRLDDASMVLVDARPDDEYTGEDGGMNGMAHPGHIPGAHQMYYETMLTPDGVLKPESELRAMFEAAGAGPGKTVVAYCMVGMRASVTYLAARMLGYDTRFYDGSWHDWGTREDLPYVGGRDPR